MPLPAPRLRQRLIRQTVQQSEWLHCRRRGTIHAESHRMETRNGSDDPVAAEEGRFRDVKVLTWGAEVESGAAWPVVCSLELA